MTKSELAFFKDALEERRAKISENLSLNAQEIEGLLNSAPSDSCDFSSIETSSQIDLAINSNLKNELKYINSALARIRDKSYGICDSCGEEIDHERLKIKPYARFCAQCHELFERENLAKQRQEKK